MMVIKMAKTVNEKMALEAVRHRLHVSRYSEAEAKKAADLLRANDDEVAGRLYIALTRSGVKPSNYTTSRLARIKNSIQDTLSGLFGKVMGSVTSSLQDFSVGEAKYYGDMLGSIIPSAVLDYFPVTPVNHIQLWAAANANPFQGALLSQYSGILTGDMSSAIGHAVSAGILQGETYEQIINRVIGTPSNGFSGGVSATAARNVATITRSAVSHVSAEAREMLGKNNSDIIDEEKWLSTLDSHTSKICIVRDNLRYNVKTKAGIGHSVPYGAGPGRIHFGCRSTAVFVVKSLAELGIDGFDMPKGTRASMNGQVPEDMDYRAWMKAIPASELERIVGVERAQLITDGKLEPSKMFDSKGGYLTLEQLRKLDRIPTYD